MYAVSDQPLGMADDSENDLGNAEREIDRGADQRYVTRFEIALCAGIVEGRVQETDDADGLADSKYNGTPSSVISAA